MDLTARDDGVSVLRAQHDGGGDLLDIAGLKGPQAVESNRYRSASVEQCVAACARANRAVVAKPHAFPLKRAGVPTWNFPAPRDPAGDRIWHHSIHISRYRATYNCLAMHRIANACWRTSD